MDEQFALFLKTFAAGLAGILIPLIGARESVLIWLGKEVRYWSWRPFSPNWITVYSLVGTLTAFVIYFLGYPVIGVPLACFAGILDRLDGRSASAFGDALSPPSAWHPKHKKHTSIYVLMAPGVKKDGTKFSTEVWDDTTFGRWWFEMNFLGGTELGMVLDPAMDKIKCLVIMGGFATTGLIPPWLVIGLCIPEIFGTLLRRPFHLFARYQSGPKATFIGKWKALFQWVTIMIAVPFHQGWVSHGWTLKEQQYLLGNLLTSCIILAGISSVTRLRYVRNTDMLKKLDKSMSHE